MLFKPTSKIDLTIVREGRKAAADLKLRVRYNTLTQGDFDRLLAKVQAAFDEFAPIIDESPDPIRAEFTLVTGGARG